MVEGLPALSQGVLANNSVTPDVEIQECNTNSSVRSKLCNAKDKKIATNNKPPYTEIKTRPMTKSLRMAQPVVTEPKRTGLDDNRLIFEVEKLSNKIESLEKNTKLLDRNETERRTFELEKKLTEITDERLGFLEKLQNDQEQWKKQYLRTVERLNEPVQPYVGKVLGEDPQIMLPIKHSTPPNAVFADKQQLLQTPLPRKEAPQPTSSVQPGNGHFLKEILDQYNASTPNLSQLTAPGRTTQQNPIIKSGFYNPITEPSPILPRPSSSQNIAREIENDVELQKIAEKFPQSFSEYLPNSASSPVTRILTKAVPQSSLVADFRAKLRRLMEMRSTLENNLSAVQRKQKLDDFAIAALADQFKSDDLSNLNVDKIETYWIQKLVDEQIASNTEKVKEEVALEMKNKSKLPPKTVKPKRGMKSDQVKKVSNVKKSGRFQKKEKRTLVQKEMKEPYDGGDESIVTHVYGKADYHPHRSTVHRPFMHVSPIKSPKYRAKRALQSIPVNYVRSEKSQTISSPTILRSKYLAPTAVSLGPPKIHENDPDPLVIAKAEPMVVISKPSPYRKPVEKPPPPAEKKVEIIDIPDELPGNNSSFESSSFDEESSEGDKVELDGATPRRTIQEETPPPSAPTPIPKSEDFEKTIKQAHDEDQVKRWVEQEIMAKILTHLHPDVSTQQTQTLNMETDALKRIIEDELLDHIRNNMPSTSQEAKPVEPEPVREPMTPLATPQSTPTASIREEPLVGRRGMKTPSLSPQSSICEVEEVSSEITPPPKPRIPTPPIEEHEVTIVPTPQATPVPSPEVSVQETSPQESVHDSPESSLSLPDPWEGKFPEDDHFLPQRQLNLLPGAPDPDPTEIVVRTVTPPPPEKPLYSSTSSESTSSEESIKDDKTISEGQLLVEHGEMIPKKRQPPPIPANIDEFMHMQNTLRDAAEFEIDPVSEGEFRPRARPVVPKRTGNFVLDDPTGVYQRPRKPRETSESEDVSVGEVPLVKRNKFKKWKESRKSSRSSPHRVKPDSPLSVGDLNATSVDSSSISEEIAPNVIMVTSATPRPSDKSKVNGDNDKLERTQSDIFMKDSLDDVMPRPQMTLTLPSTEPLSGASDTEDISVQEI